MTLTIAQHERHVAARMARKGLENIMRNNWRIGRVPSECEAVALKCEARGHWRFAAAIWRHASGVTLGHNRAARYDAAEWRCLERAKEKR